MSDNRELMERYWAAAEADDLATMHGFRDESFVVEFPQTGERLVGRDVVRAFEEAHAGGGSFRLSGLVGGGDAWTAHGVVSAEHRETYVISISELRNGRIIRSIEFFASPLPPMLGADEPKAPSDR